MPLMWFAQLRGQIKITLIVNHPCNKTCGQLYATLSLVKYISLMTHTTLCLLLCSYNISDGND